MEEENIDIIGIVLDTLKRDGIWFTQKTDPTYQEAPSYYKLDEYGDPDEKTMKKIEKEVKSLIGDGAVDISDAIELWKNDQMVDCRLDFIENLVTEFKAKPVVDGINAYENSVQFPSSIKVEAKEKKTEGAGAGYEILGGIENAQVNSFKIENTTESKYGERIFEISCDVDVDLTDLEFASYYYGSKLDFPMRAKITGLNLIDNDTYAEGEEPTVDDYGIRDALDGITFKARLGGGWSHVPFTGDFDAETEGNVYSAFYTDNVSINIDNAEVVDFMDKKIKGEMDETTYCVIDKDGDPVDDFENEDDAIKFAEENGYAEVVEKYHNYKLISADGSIDDDLYETGDTVWTKEDAEVEESKKVKMENMITLSDDDKQKYYIGKGIVGGQATPYDLYKIGTKYYNANGLEISKKDALNDMDNFKHIFGNKKTEEYDVDTYNKEQEELKKQYKDRIMKSATPEIINAFNDLNDILNDGGNLKELDGFYFPDDAITIVDLADKNYHLNSAMDLTTSNILNMVGNNDTFEQAIDELFADYDADSAYSWADNFVTVLGKLDFDLHNDGENDVYTFEVSLPDCDPLMFTADWSEEAAVKEYMENEGSMSKYTVDDISINYLDEPIPINENKKVEDYDDYVSIYDEIDDMLDYLVTDDKTKLELYNHFNSSSPLENLEGENEDVYDEWLFEFKLDNARKLKRYLNKLDDINSLEDSKCFDESKSFGRALRELKTEAKQDKTELTPEQKANKIANIGSLVNKAKYPFQLNAVVHTLGYIDQDLSNELKQKYNASTIHQDNLEDARTGIAQAILDKTGVDVLSTADDIVPAMENKNINFNKCTKEEHNQLRMTENDIDKFVYCKDYNELIEYVYKLTFSFDKLLSDKLINMLYSYEANGYSASEAGANIRQYLFKNNLIYMTDMTPEANSMKVENYQRRLEEVNNKSANAINDMLQAEGFDENSNAGKIVLKTQELFTALSDLGLNVDVTFDNGDSTTAVQLGTAGGKVMITINDADKPLKAFMAGNVELTGENLEMFKKIEDRIKTI